MKTVSPLLRHAALATFFSACALAEPAPSPANVAMPAPAVLRAVEGRATITPSLTVEFRGADDARVRAAAGDMLRHWEARTGLVFTRLANGQFAGPAAGSEATLTIEAKAAAPAIPTPAENESYALTVAPNRIALRAATTTGALRGLATLTQLLQSDASGWFVPALQIEDSPRFAWRGLLVDPSRHWLPLEVLKRNVDVMAVVKLNVLHVHLTDDQGFRIESKRFPKLHELGSDGLYYTQEQIRDLIAYAAARGIRVVPEFDVPGHATTWAVAFPELASAPGPYLISRKWGVHDVVLDPTNEALYPVLDAFFGEMAALFPDEYVHIGGDENNGKQWTANAKIQEFIRTHDLKDNAGLHAYFNRRLMKIVTAHGKKMVGWDEILHRDLPTGTVIQSWRGGSDIAAATRMGFAAMLSRGNYLDHMLPASTIYLNDPIPADSTLTPDQQKLVLGGEACMWGEWATAETFDTRTWPRAAVVAERLWSPRAVNDIADMYRRLDLVSRRLEEAGAQHLRTIDSNYRRFEGDSMTPDAAARLRAFGSLFESGTLRVRQQGTTNPSQFTPLTGFADCVTADSAVVRRFAEQAKAALFVTGPRSPESLAALRRTLVEWRSLADVVAGGKLAPASPRVVELAPLGQALRDAADIGLAALDDLARGGSTKEVATERLKTLAQCGKPQLGVTLPVVTTLRTVVAAAGLESSRIRLNQPEWSAEVERFAAPAAAKR